VQRHQMKTWLGGAVRVPRVRRRRPLRAPRVRRGRPLRAPRVRRGRLHDLGMATAEYAVVTVAACGFAGLLLAILRSGEVRGLLLGIIKRALAV
jgi:hypothetical protein